MDFLFNKPGNKGASKFMKRSQPVLESLKPRHEIEQDLERHGSVAGGGTEQFDPTDEKSSQDEKIE